MWLSDQPGTTSWTCASSAKPTRPPPPARSALWLGECEFRTCWCCYLNVSTFEDELPWRKNITCLTTQRSNKNQVQPCLPLPLHLPLAQDSPGLDNSTLGQWIIIESLHCIGWSNISYNDETTWTRCAPWITATGSSRNTVTSQFQKARHDVEADRRPVPTHMLAHFLPKPPASQFGASDLLWNMNHIEKNAPNFAFHPNWPNFNF